MTHQKLSSSKGALLKKAQHEFIKSLRPVVISILEDAKRMELTVHWDGGDVWFWDLDGRECLAFKSSANLSISKLFIENKIKLEQSDYGAISTLFSYFTEEEMKKYLIDDDSNNSMISSLLGLKNSLCRRLSI